MQGCTGVGKSAALNDFTSGLVVLGFIGCFYFEGNSILEWSNQSRKTASTKGLCGKKLYPQNVQMIPVCASVSQDSRFRPATKNKSPNRRDQR